MSDPRLTRLAIAATPPTHYLQTEPLTREQVEALPDGAEVLILWDEPLGVLPGTMQRGPLHYRVKDFPAIASAGVFAGPAEVPSTSWIAPLNLSTAPDVVVIWRIYPVTAEDLLAEWWRVPPYIVTDGSGEEP